ncbi:protein split ends isoform X3 [Hyposmocoma kahamanoa]|uniref:protein split ends isoform X3 n=1 Tax=Hyposmocoma kahamanoa TaxID=1477025 RepID=UPI000E6D8013|nr:protein split ends isoform X3 [Hyposmocoma kahamanoa]
MVRETRHLWVGNLPDNIREDRIREHFKRYGRVQNVKLLGRTESTNAPTTTGAASGVCATVAFMDIKSASKAHNAEHVLDERTLTTEYYEPAAIPSAAGAPSAGSSPAGSGYSGSSSSVNSAPAPAPTPRYHLSGGEEVTGTCALAATAAAPANWRGTNDSASEFCRRGNTPATFGRYQRNNSTAPYSTPPSNVERSTPHHRWYASGERERGATGGESTPSTPGGGTEGGGGRRRRRSGSGSSRSDSSSPEPSDGSRASSPRPGHLARTPPAPQSANALAHHNHHQWSSTASGRPLAICVRNLPTRSTDSSLKDGLYHEYKKHGKVVWVKVVGQNADRYAVVRFKKPSDVEKALEVSQDKLFFGCKISVAPHQSCDEDADSAKPYETDIDEYHPKATKTLFIGNLEKDVTQQQLRDKFKHFGRIIEIDIKKGSGGGAGYAFCQYAAISSVVEAIRTMDGEYVGASRVKLGFGKPVATTCVWVDGLTEHTEKQVLSCVSRCGGATSVCVDRAAGAALVHFEQAIAAGAAVRELRRVAAHVSAAEPDRPRLAVDYASRECQEAFYEQLEKHGGSAALTGSERLAGEVGPRYAPARHESIRFDGCASTRSRGTSYTRGCSRTPRYPSLEHFDPAEYPADRRYRVYDELGSSPQTEEASYDDRLQSVVVSPHRARKHRRDSSPEDRKHSKERHRGTSGTGGRRSRSGSRGGERHAGRRRHRRRRDGSGSRGSRAGTPLRDELDAPPTEPRRPPRERPPLPMSLPLPKFAAQLLRSAAAAPRQSTAPASAPDSPPRPPSASSSSAGSAPHSPSLEERIRSLDEKYEKWSGSRAQQDAPDRARLRHRLLEVDINEVKPSDVVRSLLAKRSVFDEDSERLEGATRAPSPSGSPRGRPPPSVPRALRYPFPAHPSPHSSPATPSTPATPLTPATPTSCSTIGPGSHSSQEHDSEVSDRPVDPRLNRPERTFQLERLGKISESDYRPESKIRLRTPSTDKSQPDSSERRQSTGGEHERPEKLELERDPRRGLERRRRNSLYGSREGDSRLPLNSEDRDIKEAIERINPDYQTPERTSTCDQEKRKSEENSSDKPLSIFAENTDISKEGENKNIERIITGKQIESSREMEEPIPNKVGIENIAEKDYEQRLGQSDNKFLRCESTKTDLTNSDQNLHPLIQNDLDKIELPPEKDDKCKDILMQNHINKELHEFEVQHSHLNIMNTSKPTKELAELPQEFVKTNDKNGKERYDQNVIVENFHDNKSEKENIEFDKTTEKDKSIFLGEKKNSESEKHFEDRVKHDRDKAKHSKEKHEQDKEKSKNHRNDRLSEKTEKEKKSKEDVEKTHVDKAERSKDTDKLKHEEKSSRHEHHKKDKRKDSSESDSTKTKKDEKHKHEKTKKDCESKRENKKDNDSFKNRKSSRDEPSKDLCRKDSTDSSTSRASYDSSKLKELDQTEIKEEPKPKLKYFDLFANHEKDIDKEFFKTSDLEKTDSLFKIKSEIKEEPSEHSKNKLDTAVETTFKCKPEVIEKQRHYSLDSPSLEGKRKERLNSCSSLPSNIGHKRRMSSQESVDTFHEEIKKSKSDSKCPERRDSKDSRSSDKQKTTKFNKGHFAKIIESKTKDDKKSQVKPPDDIFPETKDQDCKDQRKSSKKNSPVDNEERPMPNNDLQPERLQHDLDFLATLELRSSEEDERQKALRKEMKEKKRIQQLQQIQELQMQQDALHQAELMGKLKDDKKQKSDEKKKEAAREKRMSTDRKSREDRSDSGKRKNRKQLQSTDSSDSDEPKKHSIFDIIDDEPTYISMYDKVKARSCKNMQKQEEEKRQEKIKAKFSQLKQSRAKREEKKRSSWDEDSDSDHERRKPQKLSMDSSSDDDHAVTNNKKREKIHRTSLDYDRCKTNDYFSTPSNEEDSRNKLSRKNSRTRIISDTSDDETSKRSISKSPNRKEFMSEFESLQRIRDDASTNDTSDKIKKNSLLNLFGKSDSEDSKLKNSEVNDNRPSFMKSLTGDFSSESESAVSNRNSGELRKKHKKKQKKHKCTYSDDETKIESSDAIAVEGETKHKHSDKLRRHGTKKEKRKEKIRDSFEADESRETKHKKDKKSNNCFDSAMEISINIKKDGKMEDIFGPLSDESDKDTTRLDYSNHGYDSAVSLTNDQSNSIINEDSKSKDKEDSKRKRDKKRKEKRPTYVKDDDNSLDVDAVGKAIEARLFADSVDDDSRIRADSPLELLSNNQQTNNIFEYSDGDVINHKDKHGDKIRRESKEKKKKKKKSREDRQNRKEHHHHHHHHHHHNNIDKTDKIDYLSEKIEELSPKMLLDIPLPNDNDPAQNSNDLESPSLPRLTDSPPSLPKSSDSKKCPEIKIETLEDSVDHSIEIDYDSEKSIAVNDIPMPPPYENVVQDISEVPLPKDPVPSSELCKAEKFFSRDVDISEDAVRSISNLEKETEKILDKCDAHALKVSDKKLDEKPRAIISQEETEDAVAALLGESFGGKEDNFPSCYEEVESNPTHEIEIESSAIENENIPEEDAEEMRQAVQNLNASEMETKPDTPVSDSDLLLIDTDTEETDESAQDAIDQLPVNIIATNQALNNTSDQNKLSNTSTTPITKEKVSQQPLNMNEPDLKIQLPKRETVPQPTSTATPVITSWTLTNNKLLEPHVLNIPSCQHSNREINETKPTHISANIVQIKAPQNQGVNASLRPIITPNRVNANAPYQVINHMIRPQLANLQPPTIKIPPQEPHILYQKPPGIVISPRMLNDTRQNPKLSPQGEGIPSPRLTNMTILSTSPQNLNTVGLASPNAIQQRSPGQVTVVRMQQPPLSPIQAMHIPHGARTMVSPNRPNSVLVQTQGAPIHFNRLPVTPVFTPISKISANNTVQNKSIVVSSSSMIHQPKIITGEPRKNDQRTNSENENSKIILSPSPLQHSTNPTVMAQNRLISMQNTMHAGNVNSTLHLPNKVLINNVNHLPDKRDGLLHKSEQHSHLPFTSTPIIHMAGANHSSASIIQSGSKPAAAQEASSINRSQSSNVIHTINSQRLLTTVPISNVIQIDANKPPPSVLSMANIRPSTVLTKLESCKSSAITTPSLKNVVMTPLLLKTTSSPSTIRLTSKNDAEQHAESNSVKLQNHLHTEEQSDQKIEPLKLPNTLYDQTKKQTEICLKPSSSPQDSLEKCETDFEELLKDKTNEIKITNNPEKKLEVNVGKTVTLFSTNIQRRERKSSNENLKMEQMEDNASSSIAENPTTASDVKEKDFLIQTQSEDNVSKCYDSNITKINSEKVKNSVPLDKEARDSIFVPTTTDEKSTIERCFSDSENNYDTVSRHDVSDNQLKGLDENDSWSAKDINIESVIKKVDSLCNDNLESDSKEDLAENVNDTNVEGNLKTSESSNASETCEPMEIQPENRNIFELHGETSPNDKTTINRRGGRSTRGKRSEKNDRVQTRQISKPSRGTTCAKRGRGRAKVDKKIKNLVNHTANNLPGDVYDFHEDSGDETSTSPNKTEPRPRLILTIKSPLSGQSNVVATSSLSITTPKEQLKNPDKISKDEKAEDFLSPSANTRKSRRLQEKDVQRNTVDDVIEDVVKGGTGQPKVGKDNKKRQTRQTGPKTIQEKAAGSDTRKSPRGVKRSRDRSLSDASIDSSDEKMTKRDDAPKEVKIPKIAESPAVSKIEPDPPQSAKTITPLQPTNPPANPVPTPIIKPPKKMISEISAKLASAFEAAAAATPMMRMQVCTERIPIELEKPAQVSLREPRSAEIATAMPALSEPVAASTGNVRVLPCGGRSAEAGASQACGASGNAYAASSGSEAALARRAEATGGGAAPVGATEASDARVQSPALPHRPPSAHRLADRATPLLIRGGDGEGLGNAAGVSAASGAGPRLARGYVDGASLPRGAHHPAAPPAPPLHAHLPHHAHVAKQVAVVGPHHHHHPGAASRVTITSVPTVSPQGQMALSAELVRSPPPAHQQTSPVTSVYHNGEGMYHHFSHQHFQMYQQHFRATQHENRSTASPYSRTLEAEGCEAPTPPLELRRPPSARVPRPAHSPAPAPAPNPADRLIMYAAGCGRSPPPAHGTSRMPSALPPSAAPGPPHASQVPREADSLQMLLRRYPVMWQGLLALKNDSAAVQMHFVGGNPAVAGDTLPRYTDGSTPPLRIAQRMRLEPAQLDQVHRKMKLENEHCMLLALPCGRDHMDVLQQSTNLTAGFITYLQRKQAAGIVNVAPPGHHQAMYTVHIFPSCDFANENLNRIAPDLMHRVADIAHLLIVIATV